MTNKYDETHDDFFDKFDEIVEKESSKISETDTYSADAADAEYSYGSASSFRSDSADGEPAAGDAKKAEKATKKADRKARAEKAKADRKSRSAKKKSSKAKADKPAASKSGKASKKVGVKARAVAASSKFGGSASGKTARKPIKKDSPGSALLKTIIAVILMAVFAVGIYVGFIFLKAPIINTDDIYSQISQRSIMFDTEGKEIESLYFSNGNRTVIKYKDIPENMVNAVIAIEDHKFWSHNGFNFIRMIGAVKG